MNTKDLVQQINRIRWREEAEVTPEAMALIDCHIHRIRPIVAHIVRTTGKPVAEAHGIVLAPASDTPEYRTIFDALWDEGDFTNAAAREPVILTIAADQAWHLDPQLSHFPNPWRPLVDLCELGYPVSYLDAPDHSSVHLTVGLRDGTQDFPVC